MHSWERLQHSKQDTQYLAVWLIVKITSVEDQVVSPSLVRPEQIVAHNLLQLPEPQVPSHWKRPIRQRYWYSWAGQMYSKLAPVVHNSLYVPFQPETDECSTILRSEVRVDVEILANPSGEWQAAATQHLVTFIVKHTSWPQGGLRWWNSGRHCSRSCNYSCTSWKTVSYLLLHQDYMDNLASW